jgi:uncharacterized protein
MAHRNEHLLRDAYAAFARGDLAAYLSVCTDSITFRVAGKSQVGGLYTREEFGPVLIARVMALSGGTFRETVADVLANDTRGVVLAHHSFERNGKSHAFNTMHVYRIANGKLASFEEYPEDQYVFDAAWT